MKTFLFTCLLSVSAFAGHAQSTKPCSDWHTGFIQKEPKIGDGIPIDKYVVQKLLNDPDLKSMATCMVGFQVSANCEGEFSFVKQDYRNNPGLDVACKELLKKTSSILKEVKVLSPGTIGGKKTDLIFKLVVKIKHSGQPVAEILY